MTHQRRLDLCWFLLVCIDVAHSMTWQKHNCRLFVYHEIVPEIVTEPRHNAPECRAACSTMQQHGTAQHSTAQHSTAQHSTAQHSTAQTSRCSTHHRVDANKATALQSGSAGIRHLGGIPPGKACCLLQTLVKSACVSDISA